MSSLVVYEQKSSLYIDLRARVSETHGAVLQGFRRREDGTAAVAEREGAVRVGDALVAVNGADVAHAPFPDVIRMLQSCTWPLELRFEDAASLGGEGAKQLVVLEYKESCGAKNKQYDGQTAHIISNNGGWIAVQLASGADAGKTLNWQPSCVQDVAAQSSEEQQNKQKEEELPQSPIYS